MNRIMLHNLSLRSLTPAALLLLFLPALASAQNLVPGQIIERVICQKDSNHSYALYLPTAYSQAKRFPVIYGFDPAARGTIPVSLFKEAAEKYGYIVVGSNNSRNGPGVPLSEILSRLLDDTQSRLSIDGSRVLATGFSGGARVAGTLAFALKGQIAGVIAAGAGFPAEAKPARDVPFVFYGIAGSADFNLIEVRQLVGALNSLGVAARFAEFEGDHAWPPAGSCTEAIEWMELQAMKTGRRNRDEKFVAELLSKHVERARADEAAKKTFDAYLKFEALARDFQGLADTAEFTAKAVQLKSSKEVKEGFKQERAEEQLQGKYLREFFSTRERLKTEDSRLLLLSDLRLLIANLRKKSESQMPGTERTVARRTLGNLRVALMEEAAQSRFQKKYSDVVTALSLVAEIRPDNPQILFAVARAQVLAGSRRDAIESLKKAIEKGFSNLEELKTNPDLEPIRGEKAYKDLIETLSAKPSSGVKNE